MWLFGQLRWYFKAQWRRYAVAMILLTLVALLNLIPLAVRMAGPRAGLWHGIINRNYGASYFILGRDPHGPGKDLQGRSFYTSRDVQELFHAHENEIGVRMITSRRMPTASVFGSSLVNGASANDESTRATKRMQRGSC